MEPLSNLNSYIEEQVESGNRNVTIDLSQYSNTGHVEIISFSNKLSTITFDSNNDEKIFRIVVPCRNEELSINLNNVNINSGENITFDLRGGKKVLINFQGSSTLTSNNSMGIYVSNGQTIEIIGIDSLSNLMVNGGIRNAAIGNSFVEGLNTGGHIIFSGEGTVTANGGNGALEGEYAVSKPIDGAYAIGFSSNTVGSSSVVIKCNITVNANGGKGQSADVVYPLSSGAGNGGAGISLGANGALLVEKCYDVSNSLNAFGGDAGIIKNIDPIEGAFLDLTNGGDGGSGIEIVGGTVDILGCAEIKGGNGTCLEEGQLSLPVQAGDGGNAIEFTGNITKTDNIILSDNVIVEGGNGGNSGIVVTDSGSLESLTGGKGGTVIELGDNPSNIVLGSITSISGNGGNGGSPKALVDENVIPADVINDIEGANNPGTGGNNGSHVHDNALTNLTKSPDMILVNGSLGKGGNGANGTVGDSGKESKQFDIIEQNIPHFGYFNVRRTIDLSEENLIIKNSRSISEKKIYCKPKDILISPLYVSQIFENYLFIENLYFNSTYDISKKNVILANAIMTFISNTSIIVYRKEDIPIIVQI